jgi:hypothetical protein
VANEHDLSPACIGDLQAAVLQKNADASHRLWRHAGLSCGEYPRMSLRSSEPRAQIERLLVMAALTNLQLIKRSRHVPAAGDLFAMQLPTGKHLFGRVVLADPPRGAAPMPSSNLLYIYSWRSDTKEPDHQQLTPDKLLLPPIWTNRLGWTKGVFQAIENQPIRARDLLAQHCFRDAFKGIYVDETGRKLPFRVEPCGEWSLVSYRWIDDHVSDAVGIPRVPVSPDD